MMENEPQSRRFNPARTRAGGIATLAALGVGLGEAAYGYAELIDLPHHPGPIVSGILGAVIWGGGMYMSVGRKVYDHES